MDSAEKTDNLDGILAAEEELAPSSGFVWAVMERVREEAAAPKPIPFPWKRLVPGAVVAAGGLMWMGVEAAGHGLGRIQDLSSPVELWARVPQRMSGTLEDAGWVAAALGVSLLSWLLARRMIGSRGML
jgi:hypothetical protein